MIELYYFQKIADMMMNTFQINQQSLKSSMMNIFNDFGFKATGVSTICMIVDFNYITVIVSLLSFLLNLIKSSPRLLFSYIKFKEILSKYRKGEVIRSEMLDEKKENDV